MTFGRPIQLVNVGFLSVLLVFAGCFGASCSKDEGAEARLPPQLVDAQSRVPFTVIAPLYIPKGTSHSPEVEIRPTSGLLIITYREVPEGKPGAMRLRLVEALAEGIRSPDEKAVYIGDKTVWLREQGDDPRLDASWTDENVLLSAEFFWLPRSTGEKGLTDAMRADAVKVIRSMIKRK